MHAYFLPATKHNKVDNVPIIYVKMVLVNCFYEVWLLNFDNNDIHSKSLVKDSRLKINVVTFLDNMTISTPHHSAWEIKSIQFTSILGWKRSFQYYTRNHDTMWNQQSFTDNYKCFCKLNNMFSNHVCLLLHINTQSICINFTKFVNVKRQSN